MFWKKKRQQQHYEHDLSFEAGGGRESPPLPSERKLSAAADRLAASLSEYAEEAYRTSKPGPDAILEAAKEKVEAARKLIHDGRIGDALGRNIPEHMEHRPSWSKHPTFEPYFDARDIQAEAHAEERGYREVKVSTIDFTFNGSRYRLVVRDEGMSPVPQSYDQCGEVELWLAGKVIAKFALLKDVSEDFSQWRFADVKALRVGPWMKDVIDIATQIEIGRERQGKGLIDKLMLEAADNIDLG